MSAEYETVIGTCTRAANAHWVREDQSVTKRGRGSPKVVCFGNSPKSA
jgi:hypothetical protein